VRGAVKGVGVSQTDLDTGRNMLAWTPVGLWLKERNGGYVVVKRNEEVKAGHFNI
jgi:hypothetical protein